MPLETMFIPHRTHLTKTLQRYKPLHRPPFPLYARCQIIIPNPMTLTIIAPILFIVLWAVQSWLIEYSSWSKKGLTHLMGEERRRWIATMADRDLRMIDTGIIAGLQSGTAFFASTSLLAIGGAFSLIASPDPFLELAAAIPYTTPSSTLLFEAKAIGLMFIFAFAFLKFGWSYRLFNYTSILVGSVPMKDHDYDQKDYDAQVRKATQMSIQAGREFARGQRAFFIAIAYLGWFLSDGVFILSTLAMYAMLSYRQFFSPASKALR